MRLDNSSVLCMFPFFCPIDVEWPRQTDFECANLAFCLLALTIWEQGALMLNETCYSIGCDCPFPPCTAREHEVLTIHSSSWRGILVLVWYDTRCVFLSFRITSSLSINFIPSLGDASSPGDAVGFCCSNIRIYVPLLLFLRGSVSYFSTPPVREVFNNECLYVRIEQSVIAMIVKSPRNTRLEGVRVVWGLYDAFNPNTMPQMHGYAVQKLAQLKSRTNEVTSIISSW